MAMMASKGPEAVASDPETESEVRSVLEEPRRSPAPRVEEVVDWTWEAEKSLFVGWCLDFALLVWSGKGGEGKGEGGLIKGSREERTWRRLWVVPRSLARIAR